MGYTKIPLEDLDRVRASVHRDKMPGYKIRTFFLGPRRRVRGVSRNTLKADAVAAKIAVYNERGWLVQYI